MEQKYVSQENLLLYDALFKIFMQESLENKIFVGSKAAYQIAYDEGKIINNAIVILTDEGDDTTSVLGSAILGQMILGS